MIKKDQIEGVINKITNEIKEFTDKAIVGMSGGADSTLVAILSKLALGSDNVVSVHMPSSDIDLEKFNSNSERIADKLGLPKKTINIKNIVKSYSVLGELNQVNQGNLRSRVRMNVLYAVAHEEGQSCRARVMGTGNLSEDFIGYDTKGGDALADLFSIGDLYKSEVYQLLDYFADKGIIEHDMIDREPSAGLWDGQTDEDELGHTYNDMEVSIRKHFKGETMDTEIDTFVMDRHYANKHKHEAPPVISIRELIDNL
jgi:NAD+ synthase